VSLETITGFAVLECDAGPLLHDVRCFVRCGVKIRRARECYIVAICESMSAELSTRDRAVSANVGPQRRDVVRTECTLDFVEERQPLASPARTTLGHLGRRLSQ
jgi:hypothetical protein